MTNRRTAALIPLAIVLFVVMAGAQVTLTLRNTLLRPVFVDRHVAELAARIREPDNHDRVIRTAVAEVLGPLSTSLPAAIRERLVDAVRVAFPPDWIEGQITAASREALEVLRGRKPVLRYDVELSGRKTILARELATGLPGAASREIPAAVGGLPERLSLDALLGPGAIAAIGSLGRLYLPLSILLVFVGPAALVIACQIVGGLRHGLWVAGAMTLASSLALLAATSIAWGAAGAPALERLVGSIPPTLTWLGDEARAMAAEIRAMASTVSTAFAVVGGSLTLAGAAMAVYARKAGV